ncbi:MAG: hypothetical protein KIT14_22585 [bacterium]|nr:hypothetical protein [bacterium]
MLARWMGLHPNGGRFRGDLRAVTAAGYLDGVELTDAGRRQARTPPTGRDAALSVLDEDGQRTIIEAVEQQPARSVEDLAAALGVHPNGGRFRGNLRRVRLLGLVTSTGPIAPTDALFR